MFLNRTEVARARLSRSERVFAGWIPKHAHSHGTTRGPTRYTARQKKVIVSSRLRFLFFFNFGARQVLRPHSRAGSHPTSKSRVSDLEFESGRDECLVQDDRECPGKAYVDLRSSRALELSKVQIEMSGNVTVVAKSRKRQARARGVDADEGMALYKECLRGVVFSPEGDTAASPRTTEGAGKKKRKRNNTEKKEKGRKKKRPEERDDARHHHEYLFESKQQARVGVLTLVLGAKHSGLAQAFSSSSTIEPTARSPRRFCARDPWNT